jgi:hypothetical protein
MSDLYEYDSAYAIAEVSASTFDSSGFGFDAEGPVTTHPQKTSFAAPSEASSYTLAAPDGTTYTVIVMKGEAIPLTTSPADEISEEMLFSKTEYVWCETPGAPHRSTNGAPIRHYATPSCNYAHGAGHYRTASEAAQSAPAPTRRTRAAASDRAAWRQDAWRAAHGLPL